MVLLVSALRPVAVLLMPAVLLVSALHTDGCVVATGVVKERVITKERVEVDVVAPLSTDRARLRRKRNTCADKADEEQAANNAR